VRKLLTVFLWLISTSCAFAHVETNLDVATFDAVVRMLKKKPYYRECNKKLIMKYTEELHKHNYDAIGIIGLAELACPSKKPYDQRRK
jgi:hypothetical protein